MDNRSTTVRDPSPNLRGPDSSVYRNLPTGNIPENLSRQQATCTSLEEMPDLPVESIVAVGERPLKPAHPIAQIGFRRFHEQVIMIPHQHVGMTHPSGTPAHFAQTL